MALPSSSEKEKAELQLPAEEEEHGKTGSALRNKEAGLQEQHSQALLL